MQGTAKHPGVWGEIISPVIQNTLMMWNEKGKMSNKDEFFLRRELRSAGSKYLNVSKETPACRIISKYRQVWFFESWFLPSLIPFAQYYWGFFCLQEFPKYHWVRFMDTVSSLGLALVFWCVKNISACRSVGDTKEYSPLNQGSPL
jgi:hypothetical protein